MQPIQRPAIISVSELNRRARQLLETQLNEIRVEGEISNFSRPSSGHWYFTLKDSKAQIRCAMFKNRNLLVKTQPQAGDKVVLRARVSVYEARGDYQLIAESMQAVGDGDLQRQFEELKQKLYNEGLFDPRHKRPLPRHPQHIALISSASGAAVHDIIHVFQRRNPSIELHVIPAAVQGDAAAGELLKALTVAQNYRHQGKTYDAIIIGRGGGSLEDLWSFNHEALARAIFACDIPIVSAVGHEVDISICDFVADVRAPTPSAAAELLSTNTEETLHKLTSLQQRLTTLMQYRIGKEKQRIAAVSARIKHPGDKIAQWQQRSDYCEKRLHDAIQATLSNHKVSVTNFLKQLDGRKISLDITAHQHRLEHQKSTLKRTIIAIIKAKKSLFSQHTSNLHLVSPLATMQRGYTITKNAQNKVLKSAKTCVEGENVQIQFHDGAAEAKIAAVKTVKNNTLCDK